MASVLHFQMNFLWREHFFLHDIILGHLVKKVESRSCQLMHVINSKLERQYVDTPKSLDKQEPLEIHKG